VDPVGLNPTRQRNLPARSAEQMPPSRYRRVSIIGLFSALHCSGTPLRESSWCLHGPNPAGMADAGFRYSRPNSPTSHTSAVRTFPEHQIRLPSGQERRPPVCPSTNDNGGGKLPTGKPHPGPRPGASRRHHGRPPRTRHRRFSHTDAPRDRCHPSRHGPFADKHVAGEQDPATTQSGALLGLFSIAPSLDLSE
jgi:hypothetical protein